MEKLIGEFSYRLVLLANPDFHWACFSFLRKKLAWGPILDAVNERETSIKDALASAEAARTEMESLQSDNQRILKEARAEKEALTQRGAELLALELITAAKEEAQAEAQKILSTSTRSHPKRKTCSSQ